MLDNTIQEVKDEAGNRISIWYDESAESPREWDNLGTFYTWHSRYNSPDTHSYDTARDFLEDLAVDLHPKANWDNVEDMSIERLLNLIKEKAIILPVYMYEHSGRSWNTTGFSCGWDSGQVGFIYVTKEAVRKEYGVRYITKDIRDKVEERLNAEVKVYEEWAEGRVWGFTIKCADGETESVGGFYGTDYEENIRSHYDVKSMYELEELVKELG